MTEDDEEFIELWENLTKNVMEKLKVSRRTAELRISAIIKSGILDELGSPNEAHFQFGIDVAMRIPQLGEKED